ncbi:XdhC family protein, partial [Salinarimonas sp.]|uniref:XdhC family protein n=1 Tax=Salinarimonas sp. TaxID=2766526 RepID=UPI003918F8D1
MRAFERVAEMVRAHGAAALVRVIAVRGSAPREAGAWMAVRADGAFHGTIGGGELEWRALALAREALARGRGPMRRIDQSLGPDLGQCCGGRVILHVETFDARDLPELDELARAEGEILCQLDEAGRVVRTSLPATSLPVGEGGLASEARKAEWGPGGESTSSVGPHPTP